MKTLGTLAVAVGAAVAAVAAWHFAFPPPSSTPVWAVSVGDDRLVRLEERLALLEARLRAEPGLKPSATPASPSEASPPPPPTPAAPPGGEAARPAPGSEEEIARFRALYEEVRRREENEREAARLRAVLEKAKIDWTPEVRERALRHILAYTSAARAVRQETSTLGRGEAGIEEYERRLAVLRETLERDLAADIGLETATKVMSSIPGLRPVVRTTVTPPKPDR